MGGALQTVEPTMTSPSPPFQEPSETVTGADVMARALHGAGVRHAFGVPGGEILAFVAALERAGVAFILARHETAAGFMAEGMWHATGAPALLVTTLGPGATNALNVVANAFQDKVPMIVVTGCIDGALAHGYTHQIVDHAALFRPIVKATLRAERGVEALVMAKALRIACAGRPGPVHIDLPMPVAEGRAGPQAPIAAAKALAPPLCDLTQAETMLRGARRPLILAGLDLVSARGAGALDALATRLGAPVLTTYKAKGLIREDDPRVVGAVGLSPKADTIVRPLIEAADVIVLAGYDPVEMRIGWRDPWPTDKAVIELAAEDANHGMHASTLLHVGDVAALSAALAAGPALQGTWPGAEPQAARAAFRAAFAEPSPARFGPHAVFAAARRIAPPGTVATADSGAHRILLSQMWACDAPRRLLQSSGYCTMGGALPLAAGHALATGEPTLCFVGDAGLEMGMGDLATIRDHGLPVIIVVLVDDSLALIELKQRAMGLPRRGVDLGQTGGANAGRTGTDFALVTSGFGGHGVTVDAPAAFERALAEAFARRDSFSLIAARIGDRAYDGAF